MKWYAFLLKRPLQRLNSKAEDKRLFCEGIPGIDGLAAAGGAQAAHPVVQTQNIATGLFQLVPVSLDGQLLLGVLHKAEAEGRIGAKQQTACAVCNRQIPAAVMAGIFLRLDVVLKHLGGSGGKAGEPGVMVLVNVALIGSIAEIGAVLY